MIAFNLSKYLRKTLHVQLFQCINLVLFYEYTIWLHMNTQARTCSTAELPIMK